MLRSLHHGWPKGNDALQDLLAAHSLPLENLVYFAALLDKLVRNAKLTGRPTEGRFLFARSAGGHFPLLSFSFSPFKGVSFHAPLVRALVSTCV
jgi:hypothetical protein